MHANDWPLRLLPIVFFAIGVVAIPAVHADDVMTVSVPGPMEDAAPSMRAYDGFVWYRCYVKAPDRWAQYTEGQKNLYAESVRLHIGGVRDAYEVYFNGRKIGGGGSMPPAFKPDPGGDRTLKVPPGLVKKGVFNQIAIRIYNGEGDGGIIAEPPVLASYFLQFELRGEWELFKGDDLKLAGGPVKDRPERAAFDKATESTMPMSRPDQMRGGPRMSPKDSLATITTADDLIVEQLLTEPQVAQPVSMSFDERGRLWVVQFRQYPFPAGLKMLSRDKYYRAVYDKVPPAPPDHEAGADRITIHEDTNGDGRFDRHKVFMDGLNLCNSVARGRGGVWVLHPPYLLFVPDADGDDMPDGDPVVHLSGFGIEDLHAIANGLRWGPDGWLYIAQGSTVSSRVKVAGEEGPGIYAESTCVWRYHPESRRVELFASGGRNQLGVEFDNGGRLFTGTNTGGERGHHYIQGGHYRKDTGGKNGPPVNAYAFGQLPLMNHDAGSPRFSHHFIRYESRGLGENYAGRILSVDPLQRRVLASTITPNGSTFQTGGDTIVLKASDPAFRPVSVRVGPDGGLYIADFYEFYIAHGQHYQGQIDPTTGRIYRLRSRTAPRLATIDLSGLSSDELIDRLADPQKWVRQTALRLLGDRRDRSTIPRLRKMLREHRDDRALGALWALNFAGGLNEEVATKHLSHPNPDVRRWTVRLIGDSRAVSDAMSERLAALAMSEPEAPVRCQLAASARRFDAPHGLAIATALARRDTDADDPFIPLMIWWAIEAHCASAGDGVVEAFSDPTTWETRIVREHVAARLMRRFASTERRADLVRCARLLDSAPTGEDRKTLLAGFERAYQNRELDVLPDALVAALARAGGGSLSLRVRRGDAAAIDEALAAIADGKGDPNQRSKLVAAVAQVGEPRFVDTLLPLVSKDTDAGLTRSILAALLRYDEPRIGQHVAAQLDSLGDEARPAAMTLLASRPAWSHQLLDAVASGRVRRGFVSAEVVETVRQHRDAELQRQLAELFPARSATDTQQLRREINRLQEVLAAEPGNPHAGRALFVQRCAACHLMHGEGGRVGPDLTTYQRDDLPSMLTSIVDPSAEVREGFESFTVRTKDGRVITGFLADEDPHAIVLRGMDGQVITIDRRQIAKMNPLGRSLMPPGLLAGLSDEQVRDLVAFLRASQPIRR